MSLNDMLCRTIKPKDKPFMLSDAGGLYLLINPNGSKYWRLKYRLHKVEKRLALGVYPAVTLLEARQARENIKRQLKNNIDPALAKLTEKQTAAFKAAETFELLAREWHSININQWDVRYAATVLYRLEKYAFPELGTYPIHLLTPLIILACLRKIEETAPEMARRIKQIISHIFKYGIATNRAETDPTYGLEVALKKYKKGHFASIEVDELADLLKAINGYKARLYRQSFLAIKLMLLTFVRTSELVEAKWTEIDFENAMWIIPGKRMKKEKTHLVPLSKQALEILLELKKATGKWEFIFPGISNRKQTMSKGTILTALKRMGYTRKMTGHGFRSLALGILKEKLSYSHEVADRQLAHVPKSGNDRAYDRAKFLPQRIEMMQRYADYIDEVERKLILKSYRNKE